MILMKIWAVLLTMTLALAGCSGATPAPMDGRVSVVASFYPLQFVVERVGGDLVSVTSLTQPGTDPHDVELTPSQVVTVSRARLVFYQKGMQPAVDKLIETEQPAQVLEATSIVPLHAHPEADAGPADADHDHEGGDPHTWLDPTTMVAYAKAVAAKLGELDPTHAQQYQDRAATVVRELTELDDAYAKGLATCERRTFVTAHTAFGYVAERYKLEQISIAGLAPDAEPTPARIAEVQRVARDARVTTIFYETLTSPAVAKAIAGDLGLRTDVLDPIEGLTEASRGKDYIAVMTANLAALRTANGCR